MAKRKIGIYVAHDDDAIIGAGGTIVKTRAEGGEVYVVIVTDGANSHSSVFGFEEHPSKEEVKAKRKEEIKKAMRVLDVSPEFVFFLDRPDGRNDIWGGDEKLFGDILAITERERPDAVYSNYTFDPHTDHVAVGKIVEGILGRMSRTPEAFQFAIQGIIERPDRVVPIADVVERKRQALFEMKSQVLSDPYENEGWRKQPRPILSEDEVQKFLSDRETFRVLKTIG